MSNPFYELQQILAGSLSVAGKVVSVAGGLAQVATATGMVEVPSDGGVRMGGRVDVRDGRAVRVQGTSNAPVFFV